MFECPFKDRLNKDMVCDFRGVKHEENVQQCPTEIFNKCQEDSYSNNKKN